MDAELKAELEKIIAAVEFHSEDSFTFAGRKSAAVPLLPAGVPAQGPDLPPAIAQLQQFLYAYCYMRRFDGAAPEPKPFDPPVDAAFVEELSRANTSRDLWDQGWTIYEILQSGQLLVEKHNVVRAVWPGEFLSRDRYAQAPQAGTAVAIYLPRESRSVQAGFYFALGETAGDQLDDYRIVRFYWNLDHPAAPALVQSLTREFNRFEVPFRFKCPNHRAAYGRIDGSVLYVSRRLFPIAARLVARVAAEMADRLREDTPLFTRRLGRGLAFAEDTGSQESFGMARCRMLAQGLCNARRQGKKDAAAKLETVAEEFARNRVSLDRPYLNPGSVDGYEFPGVERAQAV